MKYKLGDLVKIRTGKLDANASSPEGEYPFFTCSKETLKISNYSYDCECVLVAGNGDLNVKYYHGKFDAYQRTYIIEDNGSKKLYIPYLFHFLDGYLEELRKQSIGGVIKYIKLGNLTDAIIEAPNYEKQIEIVNLLNKVKSLIGNKINQLSLLDELVKSRFVELFGDPNIEFKYQSHKFKEFATNMTKGPFGSDMKKDLFVPKGNETYKVYIQANAIQGDQNIGDYYISKEYFDKKIFKFEVHPGDYIITCDGTLGKHLKLNDKMKRGVISPSLLRLTLDEDMMTKEYFEYIWDMYMLLLMKKEARNACLVHLPSAKVIGEIDIPVPPFNIQREFSDFVKQVDKSKFMS